MQCKVFAIICLIFCISFAQYHPLTEMEKSQFRETYKAICMAFEESNYKAIIYFTPELIKRYESIMLDPDCVKLRAKFMDIEKKLKQVRKMKKVDSLESIISEMQLSKDKKDLLGSYDTILPILLENDTSRFNAHYNYYQHIVTSFTKGDDLETYTFLSGLKYVDQKTLKAYETAIKQKFDVRIAQLSATMNVDSLITFKKHYPHIKSDDINALIERSRLTMRKSISRHPSIYEYMHYRELFGDDKLLKDVLYEKAMKEALQIVPDIRTLNEYAKLFPKDEQDVWADFEDSLYTKWRVTRHHVRADIYLKYYPKGKYAAVVSEAILYPQVMYTPGYRPEE